MEGAGRWFFAWLRVDLSFLTPVTGSAFDAIYRLPRTFSVKQIPVLTSGQDLFPVIPDSTLLVAFCQLGFLINHVSFKLKCFFQIIKSGVPVN